MARQGRRHAPDARRPGGDSPTAYCGEGELPLRRAEQRGHHGCGHQATATTVGGGHPHARSHADEGHGQLMGWQAGAAETAFDQAAQLPAEAGASTNIASWHGRRQLKPSHLQPKHAVEPGPGPDVRFTHGLCGYGCWASPVATSSSCSSDNKQLVPGHRRHHCAGEWRQHHPGERGPGCLQVASGAPRFVLRPHDLRRRA